MYTYMYIRYLGRLGRDVVGHWAQHTRESTYRRHEILLSVMKVPNKLYIYIRNLE
jgi:hypothetical protein